MGKKELNNESLEKVSGGLVPPTSGGGNRKRQCPKCFSVYFENEITTKGFKFVCPNPECGKESTANGWKVVK